MEKSSGCAESSTNLDIGVKVQANLDPLVNATPQALGILCSLLFPKKYKEAARQSILAAAQNHVDSQKILGGQAVFNQNSGVLVETVNPSCELRELVRGVIQEEEITNLISCTIQAANQMQTDQSSEEVSSEFLNRWRNEAKFISEEAAQAIWGRILSEEIKIPNSVSIRTLEVIKSLTREEAEAFREACKFVFFDQYLIDSTEDKNPITHRSYVMLHDAGLLVNYQKGFYTADKWSDTTINFEDKPTDAYYLQVGNLFMFVEKQQIKEPPSVTYWKLTKAGIELYKIVSNEIEFDATATGMALIAKNGELKSCLKYAVYTDTKKQLVDFNTIQSVF